MVDPKDLKEDVPNSIPKVSQTVPEEAPIEDNYWEIKDLPSQNRFYGKIYGRPMKVLDLKKLANMDENNVTNTIETVLKRCTKGINVNDILTADKLYIIFWLRYNTFKDKGYEVGFKCSKCGKDTSYHFDLNKLDVTNVDEEKIKKMVVETSSGTFKLKYQTVGIEKEIEKFMATYSLDPLFDLDEDVVNLSACIDNGKSLLDNYRMLVDMNPIDYKKLEDTLDSISIGVVPLINVACKLCKEETLLGISFRSEFLFPSIQN